MEEKINPQSIAEQVAVMETIRQLLIEFHGIVQRKHEMHEDAVEAFFEAEKRLFNFISGLPRDVLTLDSIRASAVTTKAAVATIPSILKSEMDRLERNFAERIEVASHAHVDKIKEAADTAMNAAESYKKAAVWAQLKAIGLAMATCLLSTGIAVAGFWYWLPSYREIEALRAERAELTSTVAKLSKNGGRAELGLCGGRVCAAVEEKSLSSVWRSAETYEPMVILKGY